MTTGQTINTLISQQVKPEEVSTAITNLITLQSFFDTIAIIVDNELDQFDKARYYYLFVGFGRISKMLFNNGSVRSS